MVNISRGGGGGELPGYLIVKGSYLYDHPRIASFFSGAPWVSKSTHPGKFGNHVTVHRPPARPPVRLFPLDVQNEIQLPSRVFCYSWLVCLSGLWLRNTSLVKVGNPILDGIVFVFHLA